MIKRMLLGAGVALWIVSQTTPAAADASCPDAELMSPKLLTDICWACVFPIRVAGISLGGGSDVPSRAGDKWLCACEDSTGIPQLGVGVGFWEPARIIELVRRSGCSPSLGGINLPLSSIRQQGVSGNGELDNGDMVFYHYHMYAFPLLIMLDVFLHKNCAFDGYMDFDLIYISEFDPTWNNDEF